MCFQAVLQHSGGSSSKQTSQNRWENHYFCQWCPSDLDWSEMSCVVTSHFLHRINETPPVCSIHVSIRDLQWCYSSSLQHIRIICNQSYRHTFNISLCHINIKGDKTDRDTTFVIYYFFHCLTILNSLPIFGTGVRGTRASKVHCYH